MVSNNTFSCLQCSHVAKMFLWVLYWSQHVRLQNIEMRPCKRKEVMPLAVWASVQLRPRYFLTWWLKSTGLMVNCLLHWWQVSLERSLAPPSAGFCSTSAGALAWAWPGREGKDRAVQDGTSGGTEVWLGWWPWWGVEDKSWGTGGSELAGDPCLSTEWSLQGEIPFTRSEFELCPDFWGKLTRISETWKQTLHHLELRIKKARLTYPVGQNTLIGAEIANGAVDHGQVVLRNGWNLTVAAGKRSTCGKWRHLRTQVLTSAVWVLKHALTKVMWSVYVWSNWTFQ